MRTTAARRRARQAALVTAATSLLSLPLAPAAQAAGATQADGPFGFAAQLTGAKEVPGPGDPDGHGRATVFLPKGQACFRISWHGIAPPTAAHIHVGTKTEAGPVVVLLFEAPSGIPSTVHEVRGCAPADPAVASAIRSAPSRYYVNVHNDDYPAGAIRGQLYRR